jgi:hypothetical protein
LDHVWYNLFSFGGVDLKKGQLNNVSDLNWKRGKDEGYPRKECGVYCYMVNCKWSDPFVIPIEVSSPSEARK